MAMASLWVCLWSMMAADPVAEPLGERLMPILQQAPVAGLLIFDVVKDSNAQQADLRVGDIITHYDGQPVAKHHELSHLARTASADKKSEVLLLVHRDGQELEKTIPAGPMGVRLEDVAPNDPRSFRSPKPASTRRWNDRPLRSLADPPSHRWYWIESGLSASGGKDSPTTVGWAHHYFTRDNRDGIVLRIQQKIQFEERTFAQDVVVGLDPDDLPEPSGLRVMIDNKLVLFARRDKGAFVGQRMGIPVVAQAPATLLSSYFLPYLASCLAESQVDQWDGWYLPPASLEAAPLCQVDRVVGENPRAGRYQVNVLGRREMLIDLDPQGGVHRVQLRGGTGMRLATAAEVRERFAKDEEGFGPIENLELAAPGEPVRAN